MMAINSQWREWGSVVKTTEPVRGLRAWHANGITLSGFWGGEWRPGENVARCRFGGEDVESPDHGAPSPSCTDGIHAWWGIPEYPRLQEGDVLGVIEARGHTLIGELGFRTERAVILGITPNRHPDLFTTRAEIRAEVSWFGEYYRVPVFPTLKALLTEYPLKGRPPDEDHSS